MLSVMYPTGKFEVENSYPVKYRHCTETRSSIQSRSQTKKPTRLRKQVRGGQTHSGGLAPEWWSSNLILCDPPLPGKGPPVSTELALITPSVAVESRPDAAESRRQRGLAIAAVCRIVKKNGQWIVPSQTGNGTYRVNLDPPSPGVPMCNCPDFAERGQPCKHVFAVRYVVEREKNGDGSETITESVTITRKTTAERPTYRQDWTAYNKAQTGEKHRFQTLLSDLPLPGRRGTARQAGHARGAGAQGEVRKRHRRQARHALLQCRDVPVRR